MLDCVPLRLRARSGAGEAEVPWLYVWVQLAVLAARIRILPLQRAVLRC